MLHEGDFKGTGLNDENPFKEKKVSCCVYFCRAKNVFGFDSTDAVKTFYFNCCQQEEIPA